MFHNKDIHKHITVGYQSPVAIPYASKLKSRHSGKRWIAVYRVASAFPEGTMAVFEEMQ